MSRVKVLTEFFEVKDVLSLRNFINRIGTKQRISMGKIDLDFSKIAAEYEDIATVQKSALKYC